MNTSMQTDLTFSDRVAYIPVDLWRSKEGLLVHVETQNLQIGQRLATYTTVHGADI